MSDPANAPLRISFFTSARDNQPKLVDTSWEDLAESLSNPRPAACTPETCKRSECPEKHGPAWSPACYPAHASRARTSVQEVCALVLDVDHIPSDDRLIEILDRIPYRKIVHASHSDKPGDRCIRVVVALASPVQGSDWPQFWTAAIKHLGIPVDQATKDASRLYFLPSRPQGATTTEFGDGTDYLYVTTDGPALDPASLTAHTPDVSVEPTLGAKLAAVLPVAPSQTGRAAALDLLAAAWPAQSRHQASLALTGALAHAGWDEPTITDFMADLMAKVYPDGDPNPRKREEQARDSVAKVARQEAVSGWPSLIPHLTEVVVQATMKALGIGQKPQWIEDLVAKHGKPVKPSQDQVKAHFKAVRSKLLRQRTNPQAQHEAKILARILEHEQLADPDEDRTQALVHALRTLIKFAPEQADHQQLAQLLAHVFPLDIGQDADRPWGDVLVELLDQCAETLAEEAREDGDFDIEVSGARLGKPKIVLKNFDVALKKLNVRLRHDEFACKKLISRDGAPWEVMQDRHTKGLWLEIERKWDISIGIDKWAAYLDDVAYQDSFHPVRDYLETLEWDGVPRIHNWLHTYGQAEDTEYTRAIGRLVLVAAVRRVREPGCKFDEMLILEGDQGVQKSSALRTLCPKADWFTDDMPLHSDSKRAIEATSGKWIIECGELRGMSKADIANLKGFLSRAVDEARMAFGREVRIAPRQWVPIGTTNDAQYLHDPTGLRRFWPVAIIQFDIESLSRDRDQMWAEAAHCEAQGESIRLAPCYYALAAQEQEERRVVDTIEALIEEAFAGHVGKIKCLDVYQLLGKDAVEAKPDEQRRVGDAMRRVGWKHTRRRQNGKPIYYYIKGTRDDEAISLGVSGRKVVKLADSPQPVVPPTQPTKTN